MAFFQYQDKLAKMRRELAHLAEVLDGPRVMDMEVEQVAALLGRRAAIQHMLSIVEPAERQAEETAQGDAERREQREHDEARAAEEEGRQSEALRAALETDSALRAEVERRGRDDRLMDVTRQSRKSHGPLPGGFPDGLRAKL